MQFLKANTQVKVVIGPFVDVADGFTPETGITLGSADEAELIKHDAGTVTSISAATWAAITSADGYYNLTLTTSHTDTEGMITVVVQDDSVCLPVKATFMVLAEAAYDSMFTAKDTGFMDVNVKAISEDTTAADNCEAAFDTTGFGFTGCTMPTVTTLTGHTAQTGDSFARIGAAGAGLTAVPYNSAWDAEIQSEVNDGLVAFWTSPATLVDLVWDEVLTGGTHNVTNSSGRRLRQLQESGAAYGGYIWIDTVNGAAGTTDYENGTSDNPVDTIADANTLAASVGINRFKVSPGSAITFAAAQDSQVFEGVGWTLALGGQSVSGTLIEGATVSGNDDNSNTTATIYRNCLMGTNTLGLHRLECCGLSATITLAEAGTYDWVQCHSRVAGTGTPVVDVGVAVANTNLNIRHYSGGIEVHNMGQVNTDNMSLEGNGQLVINANCTGGTIAIRGHFPITDNAGGAVTLSDAARFDETQISQAVWGVAQTSWTDAGTFGEIATEIAAILVDTAEIGAAGAGLTAIALTGTQTFDLSGNITGNLSGSVGSVTGAVGSVTGSVTIDAASVDVIWDEDVTTHNNVNSTGEALQNASSAGDPWSTSLPGAYGAGTAGYIIGNNIDAAVSGTSTHSAADVRTEMDSNSTQLAAIIVDTGTDIPNSIAALAAAVADAVWTELVADHSGVSGSTAEALNAAGGAGDPWITSLPGAYTSGQAGYIVGTNLDAQVSSVGGGGGAYSLTVTVQDGDTNAIQGARVTIDGTTYDETSGSDGTLVFNLDNGTYTLVTVPPPGYDTPANQNKTIASANDTDTITLTASTPGGSGSGWIG